MSYHSILFRFYAGRNDRKRDKAIALPEQIIECRNISYGEHGKWNTLDVYYPFGTTSSLPTIVHVHGCGYVYGTKEVYRRYCMSLAKRGFAVVNFNYRLAPKWQFPTPLVDTNAALEWVCRNAEVYHLDPEKLFLAGDSAGAQIASQYAAIVTNPAYAALFDFTVPKISIKGIGLNCGLYDGTALATGKRTQVAKDYLGKLPSNDPRFQVLENITGNYPAAHITTAYGDYLRDHAEPMASHLRSKGVKVALECYGDAKAMSPEHVFHINLTLPEATQCNDDQCNFFRSCL